jgi:hypothetical protein
MLDEDEQDHHEKHKDAQCSRQHRHKEVPEEEKHREMWL